MPLVEMKNIKKAYKLGRTVVHALKDISLAIERGEFIALCGPSGSGKTTLLNIISTIDTSSSGSLIINNKNMLLLNDNELADFRSNNIGIIFQSFNLIPVLSAKENVMLPLQIKGMRFSEAEKKALKYINEVGLSEFINHKPDNMSGGQQQRVAIARALITSPDIVIADEPTANLDYATACRIIDIMRGLNKKDKISFIFSTHDQRIIKEVDRIIYIEDGRLA